MTNEQFSSLFSVEENSLDYEEDKRRKNKYL